MSLRKNLTWEAASVDPSIQSFEHPLFGTPFDKRSFAEMFGPVLEQLDGSSASDYIDFYFTRSPVDPSCVTRPARPP